MDWFRGLSDYLKPDKVKVAYFICLLILLNILPVFPCHSEKHIITTSETTLGVPDPPTHYFRNGTCLECAYDIIQNDYEWNNEYIISDMSLSSYTESQHYESITVSPALFWTVFVIYIITAYFISCGFSYYDIHTEHARYVRKKKESEMRVAQAAFIISCLDCGASVPVMSDYSGICPGCKRGYQGKGSWEARKNEIPQSSDTETAQSSLTIQSDLSHWNKYQGNLDEACDTVRRFRIHYPLVFITLLSFFFLMTAGLVLVYSNVRTVDGVPRLYVSGYGLVTHWLLCALGGFFIGRNVKKAHFVIPTILIYGLLTVYFGYYLAPIVFGAEHTVSLAHTMVLHGSAASLMGVSLAMASVSRYYYS